MVKSNGNVKMQVIPGPCMEDPPVGAQIVQKRSDRSLSERVLARVTHIQEPVLVPVYQKDQLQLRGVEMEWRRTCAPHKWRS